MRISACDHGGGVEISVADTGIGIAPEEQAVIFEPFRQVDGSDSRRHDGTGLGLYIVQRLLQLLGGSIMVESQINRGSTFHVWVPVESGATANPPAPRGHGLTGPSVPESCAPPQGRRIPSVLRPRTTRRRTRLKHLNPVPGA